MKIYEPIAVGVFVVVVLLASYSLGKRTGYDQGWEKANSDAFAEGHIAGYQDALGEMNDSVIELSMSN